MNFLNFFHKTSSVLNTVYTLISHLFSSPQIQEAMKIVLVAASKFSNAELQPGQAGYLWVTEELVKTLGVSDSQAHWLIEIAVQLLKANASSAVINGN